METIIRSKQNPNVKQWRKLHTTKGRKQQGAFLIEGTHLVEEAMKANQIIEQLIMTERYFNDFFPMLNYSGDYVIVSPDVFAILQQTEQSQGIIAVVQKSSDLSTIQKTTGHYILLDSVQDPGNLGTIIRTADAAGFAGVILGDGCVDCYNPKVLRSTQGSLWHLDIVSMPLEDAIDILKQQQYTIYATALHQDAVEYKTLQQTQNIAIIVGNEGNGVQSLFIELADEAIYIQMKGQAESLNVAIAAGILMFHFA